MMRLVFALLLLASPVRADPVPTDPTYARCSMLDRFAAILLETHGETRRGTITMPSGYVLDLWTSDATGTWTVSITIPRSMTCLIGEGQTFSLQYPDLSVQRLK